MKRTAYWLLAASPALFALPINAAEFQVADSAGLQSALSQAAASSDDDTIILGSGTTLQTINNQPFAYNSVGGGNLTIESEGGAILDGANLTEILSLRHASSELIDDSEDNTLISIRNITIQNGQGSGDIRKSAGLAIYGANAFIESSKLLGNTGAGSDSGAALYFDGERNYTLTLSNAEISGNTASPSTRGAVAYVYNAEKFTLTTNSLVSGNSGNYGVFYLDDSPTEIVQDTRFENNTARAFGTIYPTSTDPVIIKSSSFINNEVTENTGAGVLGFGNYQIEDSLFEGNKAPRFAVASFNRVEGQYITNSRFRNNQSESSGILKLGSTAGSSVLSNLLFQNNTVAADSGVVACASNCQILNSVFSENQGGASVHTSRVDASDTIVANSVFLGSNKAVGFSDASARATMYNNFLDINLPALNMSQLIAANNIQDQLDPGLDASDDFRTLAGSVLIDAGTTDTAKVTLPEIDIRGNARVAGNNVDIGWEEFGSTNTTPIITNFELLSENASNLDLLQFRLEYELAENEVVAAAEFMTDETEMFQTISLDNNIFEDVMIEGGPHTVTVKITDASGESASQDLSFELNTLDTLEVINRIEANTKDLCAEDPISCGIDTDAIRQEGYDLGQEEAIAGCLTDPEACGVDVTPYVEQGREEGQQLCIEDPTGNCGIEISDGSFDTNLIPNMGEGWKLYGTGQDISNLSAVFQGTAIVWALQNDQWHAFSGDAATQTLLEQNEVPQLQAISANSGFWVKK